MAAKDGHPGHPGAAPALEDGEDLTHGTTESLEIAHAEDIGQEAGSVGAADRRQADRGGDRADALQQEAGGPRGQEASGARAERGDCAEGHGVGRGGGDEGGGAGGDRVEGREEEGRERSDGHLCRSGVGGPRHVWARAGP